MQEEKRKVWKLTVIVVMILLICTIISGWIYDIMLPQVVAVSPFSGELSGEQPGEYKYLVPVSTVYTDSTGSYVFRIKENDGSFRVECCDVKVLANDELYAAIYGYLDEDDCIVAYPSRHLADGENVKVME